MHKMAQIGGQCLARLFNLSLCFHITYQSWKLIRGSGLFVIAAVACDMKQNTKHALAMQTRNASHMSELVNRATAGQLGVIPTCLIGKFFWNSWLVTATAIYFHEYVALLSLQGPRKDKLLLPVCEGAVFNYRQGRHFGMEQIIV